MSDEVFTKIFPDQLVGKHIAVIIPLPGQRIRTFYGIGKDGGDTLAVECNGFAFHFEKELWNEFDIRATSDNEFIIAVKSA